MTRVSAEIVALDTGVFDEAVPRDEITSLQVRTGRRGRAAKGAKIGALVWLGFSALALVTAGGESGVASPQSLVALGVSTAIGAGIGAVAAKEEWRECCSVGKAGREPE